MRIRRQQPHERRAPGTGKLTARERALPDEIPLVPGDHGLEPQIRRRHRAVGLLPHHDEPALGPEHVQRFGAEGANPEARAVADERAPQMEPVAGRHIGSRRRARL